MGLDQGLEGWCGVVGRGLRPRSGGVVWCYVNVTCEFGFSVQMTGPGICIL